ncbi:MAG: anti-sigma factor RsiW [Bacteroidia bacterium]|jgi:anti-sigma factor RsiW
MSTNNPTKCTQLTALVPGYLDGELSEEQAAPLRRHLLSCPSCRRGATELTNLKRWAHAAVASDELAIPAGFSARVAQAAFHGGPSRDELIPHKRATGTNPATAAPIKSEPSVLTFVLGLTSIAAALLISLSFFIGVQGQPRGSNLSAQPMPGLLPEVLRELDELNAKDLRIEKARRERETLKEQGRFKR